MKEFIALMGLDLYSNHDHLNSNHGTHVAFHCFTNLLSIFCTKPGRGFVIQLPQARSKEEMDPRRYKDVVQ